MSRGATEQQLLGFVAENHISFPSGLDQDGSLSAAFHVTGIPAAAILKGGMIAAAAMGDPNASIPTPQPVHYRPMFGAFGGALKTSLTFVSRAALQNPAIAELGLGKPLRLLGKPAQERIPIYLGAIGPKVVNIQPAGAS